MRISVETDIKAAVAALENLAKEQVPYATQIALNSIAKGAQANVEAAIRKNFDRPKPYTQRSVAIRYATKRRLQADVFIRDGKTSAAVSRDSKGKPVKILHPHVASGGRSRKPFENLLQARGLMPQGWFTVAGKDIPRDQFGNIPSGVINRVLSQLQAHSVYNVDRNESTASKARQFKSRRKRLQRYFVVMPGHAHLRPGIWERTSFGFGSAIRPLFIYVQRSPLYRKRLPFNEIVERTVQQQFAIQFARGVAEAQRTAR